MQILGMLHKKEKGGITLTNIYIIRRQKGP